MTITDATVREALERLEMRAKHCGIDSLFEHITAVERAVLAALAAQGEARPTYGNNTMTEDQIKHMVDRFLSWKLPENFRPDGGIIFSHTSGGRINNPVGTNLFDATQTTAMVRHMIEGMPAAAQGEAEPVAIWRHEPNGNNWLEVTQSWKDFSFPDKFPLYSTRPTPPADAAGAMQEAAKALEPFALMSAEGVVKAKTGHVAVTTCAEYFHRAHIVHAMLSAAPSPPSAQEAEPLTVSMFTDREELEKAKSERAQFYAEWRKEHPLSQKSPAPNADAVRVAREALESAQRVLHFDLRKMRVFGEHYNQAVVDAGDRVSAAVAQLEAQERG